MHPVSKFVNAPTADSAADHALTHFRQQIYVKFLWKLAWTLRITEARDGGPVWPSGRGPTTRWPRARPPRRTFGRPWPRAPGRAGPRGGPGEGDVDARSA